MQALHSFLIGVSCALLLFFGLVVYLTFEPFGFTYGTTAVGLYFASFLYVYLFTRRT